MTQLPSEKFNVAWFKLAEFVSRKERERAFGIYRLLSHSLSDEAFALQLEGDLYLAFNDQDRALETYKKAVRLYECSGRAFQAATLYEQISLLQPHAFEPLTKMLELYKSLSHEVKIARCAAQLIRLLVQLGNKEQAYALCDELILDAQYRPLLHEAFVRGLLCCQQRDGQELEEHIQAALNGFLRYEQDKKLTTFLAALAALDTTSYDYACSLVSKHVVYS